MPLSLDRVEIESVGSDPTALARAVHRQLPSLEGSVPVNDIARALDIEEIRAERLASFEGCLLTDRQKSFGAILVNVESNDQRRRYTVGHELGHFLNERHVPFGDDGFHCTKDDLSSPTRTGAYLRQEQEANRFAIELLAPEKLIRAQLSRPADLGHALAIAKDQRISREAAARRYIELHDECLALVLSVGGRVRYVEKGNGFPRTAIWAGDTLPIRPRRRGHAPELTTFDEVSAVPWLIQTDGLTLFAQTLTQAEGYSMTLLLVERDEPVPGDGNW